METITFTLGGNKKMVFLSTLTEGRLLVNYLAGIKEKKLPDLLAQCEIHHKTVDVPNYLIGAYKAKGYKVSEFAKLNGTYSIEVVPHLVFQVVNERESLSWERIE